MRFAKENTETLLAMGAWRRLMKARGSRINMTSVTMFETSKLVHHIYLNRFSLRILKKGH